MIESFEEIDFDFAYNVSTRVREILLAKDKNASWFQQIKSFYEENDEYPDDIITELNKRITEVVNADQSFQQVKTDFKKILNFNEEGISDQLISWIFYPEDDEEQLIEPDPNDGDDEPISFTPEENDFVEENDGVIDMTGLEIIQENTAKEISAALSFHIEVAEVLLKEFGFKKDSLYSTYSGDGTQMFRKIGITQKQSTMPIHLKKCKAKDEYCNVCFCDDGILYSLPCKHYFCENCWRKHLTLSISSGHYTIYCQQENCKCQIVMRDVVKFCGDSIAGDYSRFILEHQIAMDGNYKHCLRPSCPNVLTLNCVGLCSVATCSCGFRLCWKCGEEAHAPLSCELVKQWRKITKDEVLEAKWIVENTKPCPRCHERIEKNGGCNHMTCQKASGGCGYEFCWICGHEWNSHKGDGYNCNKFIDFDSLKRTSKTPEFDLKRLNHYHTHYMSQKTSQSNERKNRELTISYLINAFENARKQSDRLPVEEALKLTTEIFQAIDTARSVLIWSYPHAFYMNACSNELKLFEHVQAEVERILEQMTDMVENQRSRQYTDFRKMKNLLVLNTEALNKHVDSYST